jgi:peroxiredoxin
MVHLQRVHEAFAGKGLVVLGYNCSDDAAIARDLMKKQGVNYPTILDGSEQATHTFFQRYWGSGVPLNYVIDREGRVAAAWYGYQEKDPRRDEVFAKLGLAMPK